MRTKLINSVRGTLKSFGLRLPALEWADSSRQSDTGSSTDSGRRDAAQDAGVSELQFHYLFEERFRRPGKGNDKGKVENLVKVARRSFFVPAAASRTKSPETNHIEARSRKGVAKSRYHQQSRGTVDSPRANSRRSRNWDGGLWGGRFPAV